jgi:hypothetical protein
MVTSVSVEELQEQLLLWAEELMQREEALVTRVEKARIFEMALVKVSANLDAKQEITEATRKDYLDKMEAHTARAKHSLSLNKMLRRRRSSSMGESGSLSCMRWHWWRHSPEVSTPRTTMRS